MVQLQLLLPGTTTKTRTVSLDSLLIQSGLAASRKEARKLIDDKNLSMKIGNGWIGLQYKGDYNAEMPIETAFYMRAGRKIRKVVLVK